MQTLPPEFQHLKDRMRSTWMAGDFGQVAQYSAHGAEEFVTRLNISPNMQVLDVACGTGNLAIPAALQGARVTGVDIAPNLLEQARRRAEDKNLSVTFDEGDAENLPYADSSFDLVMSMFGAMFAPRPELVAQELARVCRPHGIIAMANWIPQGFTGKMFALSSRYVPPPEGIAAPILWGDEQVVRQRLGPFASNIETTRRELMFEYPFPPADVIQFFRRYFGPTKATFARLDEAGQAAFASDLEALWSEHNRGAPGKTLVRNEYLEVIATRLATKKL